MSDQFDHKDASKAMILEMPSPVPDELRRSLETVYAALLRQPLDSRFRILHQPLYAHVRDAIAEIYRVDPETVQDHFNSGWRDDN